MRLAIPILVLALVSLPSPAPSATARPIVVVGANQSFNWSGYVQGSLEPGKGPFHSIAATWIVPTATQYRGGEAEFSSSWIGIGGGCLDTTCMATDPTLIQAGIGHDVDGAGHARYYAWWETIPRPLVETTLPVHAGDRVAVAIVENRIPEVWTIVIVNLTARGVFSLTLPYPSTYGSAEWVIETPVVLTDAGNVQVGPMPNLSVVRFDYARANGVSPRFITAERMELVDFDLTLIATPSLADGQGDGFNDCTYTATCPAP